MAKGRKRKPDKMKVIQGTFRNDRSNPNAPAPDPKLPMSPSWLSGEAREYFGILKERLDNIGLASKTHTEMLALAALRLAEIDALSETIATEGATYTTYTKGGAEIIKGHPAVGQRNDAMRHLQGLLAEFGLSPASVGKVSMGKKSKGKKKTFGSL